MALDVDPSVLVGKAGHDGSELIDGYPRAFHIQELARVARDMGFSVEPVEYWPMHIFPSGLKAPAMKEEWLTYVQALLNNHTGVITGVNPVTNGGHAVAFDRGRIYDPDPGQMGRGKPTYPATSTDMWVHLFVPQTIWIIQCRAKGHN